MQAVLLGGAMQETVSYHETTNITMTLKVEKEEEEGQDLRRSKINERIQFVR